MTASVLHILYKYGEGKLSPNPQYYAGNGNNPADLNSSMLEHIYQGVSKELGRVAARSYVQMVNRLTDTSASGFLISLYRLEAKGWNNDAAPLPDVQSPEANLRSTISRIFGVTATGDLPGTHDSSITGAFLKAHWSELAEIVPKEVMSHGHR